MKTLLKLFTMAVVSCAVNAGAAELSSTRVEQVGQFSYLFVGGYGNELVRGRYFRPNIQAVHEMGAVYASAYFPSSFRAAESNLEVLRTEIFRMYEASGRRPVMLFGHSKGGLESLALVLRYPELVREGIVANVTLIQAPIGGNSLMDGAGLLTRLYGRALSVAPGFRSLQTKGINSIIAARIEKLDPKDRMLISKAVRYVISHKDVTEAGFALRTVSKLVAQDVQHDWLVAKRDMWIPNFGTILDSLYINHFEVVVGEATAFIAEHSSYEYARAFTQSMIINLLKSRNRRNPEYRHLTKRTTVERFGPKQCSDIFYSLP